MPISSDEYSSFDAIAMADLVQRGEVTALELVEEAIARIETHNGTLNAVITPMYDHARMQAGKTLPVGPFSGVPFLMKDFCAEVAGFPFTECSSFLRDYVPDEDSELYRRICNAGLVSIGKTNLPEFAIGATTEPRLFGATKNPWDITRTTGGSSGGAAAAVATRIVPMAHGNDIGGSIRIPASCCGLVGLKPSRGRSSTAPHYGDIVAGFFSEHVLTRSVRDSAAMLDAIQGPAVGEPYYAPSPQRPFIEEVKHDPGKLKIGFSTKTPFGDDIHPDCVKAVQDTARVLESLGHIVEEAVPCYAAERLWRNFTSLLASGVAWAIADWARRINKEPTADDFESFVWAFAERGRSLSSADYLLAMQDVQFEVRAFSKFFEEYDLFMTPTLGKPPVELGTLVFQGDPIELRRKTSEFSPYTYVSNVTGQPAISLPLHWNDQGLPVGVHFVARYPDDAILFRLAAQLEQAKPWADRIPPICNS
ncbi:MAG: amidase [Gammaproteobacteria bacterium]|nr:amidase [Gammaproteobacteria bacterium]